MIDVSNRVLTNIKTYVSDICQTVQSDSTKTPATFPALSVEQIDDPDAAVDLENGENAVSSTIELQAFSNKNITEAKTLINKACDGMRIMGYRRAYGPKKVTNVEDTNIYRMLARFSRTVSTVDQIEKFKTNGT